MGIFLMLRIYERKMALDGGLNLVRAIDPRTDVNGFQRKTFSVFDGPSEIGYQRIPPTGGLSNSILTFDCDPPSRNVFVNRRAMIELAFDITFTGVSAGAGIPLLQIAGARSSTGANVGTQFMSAPRAFPLANAFTNITLRIGNNSISQNLNSYIRAFTRYSMDEKSEDINFGMTPSMLDQAQNYVDLNGFARSPLRGYGDNESQVPRGGFVGIDVLSNTATGVADTAVVRLRCTEYFMMSPMLFQEDDFDTGFYGLQSLSLQLSLAGRGNSPLAGLGGALWSHSTGVGNGTLSSIATTVVDAQAIFSFLTPDATMSIPRNNLYSFYQPALYLTNTSAAIAAGGLTTIQMNNVQLGSIPSRIYFFVADTDSSHSVLKSDVYWGIENIAISWDNHDNLLANCTEQDLFNFAVKNGSNLSWTQWKRHVGSVLALDLGSDIPLKLLQAVGMRGSFNLRATVQCRNLGSAAQIPTLTCVVISEGIMSIQDTSVQFDTGILDASDVLASKSMPEVIYHPSGNVFGGNFWRNLGAFGRKAGKFIQKGIRPALDIAKKLAPALAPEFSPYVEKADEVARALGYGKRGRKGSGLVGGRKLSRQELASMLSE